MERNRKVFHLCFGLLVLSGCLVMEREVVVTFLLACFLGGALILNGKLRGMRVPVADELLVAFGRRGKNVDYGAFWFVVGLLMIVSFSPVWEHAASGVLMLGFADCASTLAGAKGRRILPYSRNKTFEGSLAFVLVSLLSGIWLGLLAVPFSILGAVAESVDFGIDDNLAISLFSVAFFFILG